MKSLHFRGGVDRARVYIVLLAVFAVASPAGAQETVVDPDLESALFDLGAMQYRACDSMLAVSVGAEVIAKGSAEDNAQVERNIQQMRMLAMDSLAVATSRLKEGLDGLESESWKALVEKLAAEHQDAFEQVMLRGTVDSAAVKTRVCGLPMSTYEALGMGQTPPYEYAYAWLLGTMSTQLTMFARIFADLLPGQVKECQDLVGSLSSSYPHAEAAKAYASVVHSGPQSAEDLAAMETAYRALLLDFHSQLSDILVTPEREPAR